MKSFFIAPVLLAAFVAARPTSKFVRRTGECTNQLINVRLPSLPESILLPLSVQSVQAIAHTILAHQFDDPSITQTDPNAVEPIQGPFAGFTWDGFGFTSCPGGACNSFPANVTRQYTPPRLAMSEGFVGGLLNGKLTLKTSPEGSFALADPSGSFDLGPFDVFDIIDLPVRPRPLRTLACHLPTD